MIELINSEKMAEVAEQPKKSVLRYDLQYFAGEGDEDFVDDDLDIEDNDDLDDNLDDDDTGEKIEDPADPQPSFKDDPQNQAFAQMRREKEALEQQTRQMDALISQQYGDSHNIHTFAEYQAALAREQQEAERQQYIDAGLPENVIDKLSKVDEIIQRDQQRQEDERRNMVNEQINTEFSELTQAYPDLGLKEITDVFNLPIYEQMQDKVLKGYSLLDAYEVANRAELRSKNINAGKQKALNQLNSKAHIRGNGGSGADDVDLTSIPADTLQVYRQMFAKELRTGKMKEADFVKHYKKSQ